jgi:hypothetical protein
MSNDSHPCEEKDMNTALIAILVVGLATLVVLAWIDLRCMRLDVVPWTVSMLR